MTSRNPLKTPFSAFTAMGLTIMSLLLMLPFWNAVLMLHDPVFVHFLGRGIPAGIITTSVCLMAFYIVVILLFFRCSQKAARGEQNFLMIGNLFVTALGALVLIISMPVRRNGVAFAAEIWGKCQYGLKAHALYKTYRELATLRRTPGCATMASVESCPGFEWTPHTQLLKEMELKYKCSGWCSPPQLVSGTGGDYAAGGLNLLQVDGGAEDGRGGPSSKASRLWAFRDLRLNLAQGTAGPEGATYVYPPTLFSTMNFQATCDGMAARDTQYFLSNAADELYYEGVYLLMISIAIGFLKLMGFCVKDNIFSQMRKHGYGAAAYDSGSRRYVSQGVLH